MPSTPTEPEDFHAAGKGRPTPSRKEAEAARKRPLVPQDRKLAARQDRAAARETRDREFRAMQSGDERYLPARDKGPRKRWIRDYVDARRNLGELFLPFALVGVISIFLVGASATAYYVVISLLYAGIFAGVIDSVFLGRRIKAGLEEKFGSVERGERLYGVLRATQLRRWRMPRPQVARGQYPS